MPILEIFEQHGFRVFDVSYIEFNSRNENTRDDNVIPIVYLFVDGGGGSGAPGTGLTVRVRYGQNPTNQSNLFKFTENIGNTVTEFINNVFKIQNNMAYVIVYMEKGSTLELGCPIDRHSTAKQDGDLIFAYSVYGAENTKVVLHDDVTLLGEIYCDTLEVGDNTKVIYTNSSGSQIAKQKVAEFWTVSNFTDVD